METQASGSLLTSLSIECLEMVTSYLFAGETVRLWLCGNARLLQQLANGGVKSLYFNYDVMTTAPKVWIPPALTKNLVDYNIAYPLAEGLPLEELPSTLKRLNLRVDKLSLPGPTATSHATSTLITPLVLCDKFPELTTLRLHCSDSDRIPLWRQSRFCLPATLTALRLPDSGCRFSQSLLENLPNLTMLRGELRGELTTDFEFPANLKSLHLCARDSSIFPAICKCKVLKNMFIDLNTVVKPDHAPYLHTLPASLRKISLHCYTPLSVLSSLPPELESLDVVLDSYQSHLLFKIALPKTLKSLAIQGVLLDNMPHAEFFQWLPPSITAFNLFVLAQKITPAVAQMLPRSLRKADGILVDSSCFSALPPHLEHVLLSADTELTEETVSMLPKSLCRIDAQLSRKAPNLQISGLFELLRREQLLKLNFLDTRFFEIEEVNGIKQYRYESTMELPPLEREASSSRSSHQSPKPGKKGARNCLVRIPLRFESILISHRLPRPLVVEFGPRLLQSPTADGRHASSTTKMDKEKISERLERFDTAVLRPFGTPRESTSLFQGNRGLIDLTIRRETESSIPLTITTRFPRWLNSLDIGPRFQVDLSVFDLLPSAPHLSDLSISSFYGAITNAHLALLPRKLQFLQLYGASSSLVSVAGLKTLPPLLLAISMTGSPTADEEFDSLSSEERRAVFPRRLATLEFSDKWDSLFLDEEEV